MTFHYTKLIQVLIWLVFVANIVCPFGGMYGDVITAAGVLILVVHTGEYVIFHKTIHKLPESKPVACLLTIVFGILYWRDFPNGNTRQQTNDSE